MKNLLPFILALFFHTVFSQEAAVPSFVRDSLDTYVERALKEWQIPGVAVCVVKDGKVVVMKGYGIREKDLVEKVDENTLFMIGSNTKAFTATALAMLEEDKKLSLNDPVQKWLPDFKLFDPWVTKEATVRDLLCHRLGFETFQGDFMFFDSDLTSAEVRDKFSKLKPIYSFRSRWGYTNAAFLTAGEVVAKVSGKSWAAFMRDQIFSPLEMNNTLALSAEIPGAANRASAHTIAHGELKKVPYGKIDALAPAGTISSSVNDMSHWVIMQLDSGKYKGKIVVPQGAIISTRSPNSILGDGGHMLNKAHFQLYGLGWILEEYEGRKVVAHTGGVNGFVTSVCLIPEERLGIVVLTNTDSNSFFEALRNELQDAYLGLPYRNYSNMFLQYQKGNEHAIEEDLRAKRDTIAMKLPTALPLTGFTGNYVHEVYGKMSIQMEGQNLIARFEHHKSRYATLSPLGGSRFLASFSDPLLGIKVWPFEISSGKVKSVTVRVADFVEFTPYVFTKVQKP